MAQCRALPYGRETVSESGRKESILSQKAKKVFQENGVVAGPHLKPNTVTQKQRSWVVRSDFILFFKAQI